MTDARAVVAAATARLRDAGVPSATSDARWLVSHLLGTSPAGLLFTGPLSDDEVAAIDAAVAYHVAPPVKNPATAPTIAPTHWPADIFELMATSR